MGSRIELALSSYAEDFNVHIFDDVQGVWSTFNAERDTPFLDPVVRKYVPKANECQTAETALEILLGLQKENQKDISSLQFACRTIEFRRGQMYSDLEKHAKLSTLIQLVTERIRINNMGSTARKEAEEYEASYRGRAAALASQAYASAIECTVM